MLSQIVDERLSIWTNSSKVSNGGACFYRCNGLVETFPARENFPSNTFNCLSRLGETWDAVNIVDTQRPYIDQTRQGALTL